MMCTKIKQCGRPAAIVPVLALAVIFLAGFVAYMRVLHPQVVFMDSLRFLMYFDNSEQGRASLLSTWDQGEHHGLIAQTAVYLNAKLFGLSVFPAALLSGLVLAITGIVLGLHQYRTLKPQGTVSFLAFMGLAAITFLALFSLANWELYALDVGSTLFIKNFIFILYWVGLERALGSSGGSKALRWTILASTPVIILVLAYGWAYAFVIASIFCIFVADPKDEGAVRFRRAVAGVLVISIVLFVVGGYVVPNEISRAGNPSLLNAVVGLAFALSTAFMGSETITSLGLPTWVQYLAAFVLLGTASGIVVAGSFSSKKLPLLPLVLILYGGLHVAAVSYARGRFDPAITMAPRYSLDITLIVIGVIWSTFLAIKSTSMTGVTSKMLAVLALVISLAFVVGHGITASDEWTKAPYRHDVYTRMQDVTLFGVNTKEDAALLQQPIELARRGVEVQREYGLGPYRRIGCAEPVHGAGWLDKRDGSGWISGSARAVLRNCGGTLVLNAYIPDSWPARNISVSVSGAAPTVVRIIPGVGTPVYVPVSTTSKFLDVKITVDKTTRPSLISKTSLDDRDLGLIVTSMRSEDRPGAESN
jgi:hypothetical protein